MIKRINIGGKERGFSFGLGFLGELLEETNLSIEEVGEKMQKNPFKWIPTIMFYSTKYHDESTDLEVDYTKLDIINWIDEIGIGSDQVTLFMKSFIESLSKGVPVEESKPADTPKKK